MSQPLSVDYPAADLVLLDLDFATRYLLYQHASTDSKRQFLLENIAAVTTYTLAELLKRGRQHLYHSHGELTYLAYRDYVWENTVHVSFHPQDRHLYAEIGGLAAYQGNVAPPENIWNAVATKKHEFRIVTLQPGSYKHLCDDDFLV